MAGSAEKAPAKKPWKFSRLRFAFCVSRVSDFRVFDIRVSGFRVSDFRVFDFRVSGFRVLDFRVSDFRVSDRF
jgi:hypothetical protein